MAEQSTEPDHPSPPLEHARDDFVMFIHDTVHDQAAIVRVQLDPARATRSLAYDARQLSAAAVERLAGRMPPTFDHRFETCTMRLGASAAAAANPARRCLSTACVT